MYFFLPLASVTLIPETEILSCVIQVVLYNTEFLSKLK